MPDPGTPDLAAAMEAQVATWDAGEVTVAVQPGDDDPLVVGDARRSAPVASITGTANSPSTVGHFGGRGTFPWVDPEAGVTCAALTGREFGPWALEAWPRLSDAVLDHAARRATGS